MLSLLLNKCQSRVISISIDVVIFGEFEGGFSEYQRCANIDIKNMLFTVQLLITFCGCQKEITSSE